MQARTRIVAGLIVTSLLIAFPLSVFAGDAVTDQPVDVATDYPIDEVTDRTTDKATDRTTDKATDRTTDKVTDRTTDKVTDRITDKVTDRITDKVTDRITDRPTDKITDRPTDRCDYRRFAATHDRCVDDHRAHDFNVRELIYRLIHAGEWEKLVRLLHWLGWI